MATDHAAELRDQMRLVWADDPVVPQTKNIMERDVFALKLDDKNADQTAQLCMDMEQGLTTTGHVTTPNPTPAALATQRGLLGPLQAARSAAVSALAMADHEIELWQQNTGAMLVASARNSQTAVGGNRTKMGELMIPLRALPTITTDNPEAIQDLHADDGDMLGETDWSWPARKPGRPLYHFETAPSPTGPWTLEKTLTKSKYTTHSTPGDEIWGRVTVELNGFKSDPSQPVFFRPH